MCSKEAQSDVPIVLGSARVAVSWQFGHAIIPTEPNPRGGPCQAAFSGRQPSSAGLADGAFGQRQIIGDGGLCRTDAAPRTACGKNQSFGPRTIGDAMEYGSGPEIKSRHFGLDCLPLAHDC